MSTPIAKPTKRTFCPECGQWYNNYAGMEEMIYGDTCEPCLDRLHREWKERHGPWGGEEQALDSQAQA